MNLDATRQFLERLKIRDRRTGVLVPFKLNPNQLIAHNLVLKNEREKKPHRYIIDKSRRVGMSSYFDSIAFCHCLTQPNAVAWILAHESKSSKELFRVPLGLGKSLPFKLEPPPTKHQIFFPHREGQSEIAIATAGNAAAGRGGTLTFLHLSEAAFYPQEASFGALLPAADYAYMIVIESTANGKVWVGEPFYNLWKDAIEGHNDYTPIFLSWTDDPMCTRDPEEASDAPIDDEERDLMKSGLTKAQLAWRRHTLNSPECQGRVELLHQEYPVTWEESFVSTGNPCFDASEVRWAERTKKKPKLAGRIKLDSNYPTFEPHSAGPLFIWHKPQKGHFYYIGADAARGEEWGDFAAAVVWDGSTGELAAKFSEKYPPEMFAELLNGLGRWYNRALINPELTGNLGREVQRRLRDQWLYPNLYRWKGKDDRAYNTRRVMLGWETTSYSRSMAMNMFRASIREGEIVEINAESLISQMAGAVMEDFSRWDVEKGHDDELMAALIGWAACKQYPPPKRIFTPGSSLEKDGGDQSGMPEIRSEPGELGEVDEQFQEHMDRVLRQNSGQQAPLEGI